MRTITRTIVPASEVWGDEHCGPDDFAVVEREVRHVVTGDEHQPGWEHGPMSRAEADAFIASFLED